MFKKSIGYLVLVGAVFVGCGGGGSTVVNSSAGSPILSVDKNLTITKNKTAINAAILNNSGSAITSCSVTPDLPEGLTLHDDCTISGTVAEDVNETEYTFTATNAVGGSTVTTTIKVSEAITGTVSGTITYDYVPVSNHGLDYAQTEKKLVRGAVVEVIDIFGNVLGSTDTDSTGHYSVEVTGTMAKVRVLAKLFKSPVAGEASWSFNVKDNTNEDALYASEGGLHNIGTAFPSFNVPSGWNGSSYSSTRAAAPFAILDVVYQAVQKIKTAQSDAVFPPLDVFWSVNNLAASGNTKLGQITTSHFNGESLYILGKEDQDTDEYDTGVVAHEWSHYYEAMFSRSDSVGGPHGEGDQLDIRLAFGEGFGTAVGCMIIESNLYRDSLGSRQHSLAVSEDLEAGGHRAHAGWYSEASVYDILYDIYDSHDDTGDTLSLGFDAIHKVLIDKQKNTPAFTSIFSFITALKEEYPGNDDAIDAITTNESIAPITDIYGTDRTNRKNENANPLYNHFSVGQGVYVYPNYDTEGSSSANKLGTYTLLEFTIPSDGNYTMTITAQKTGSDMEYNAYREGAKKELRESVLPTRDSRGRATSNTAALRAGKYRMELIDYNLVYDQRFLVTIEED